LKIAILETEQKLAYERQVAISDMTAQWETKLQNLQSIQLATSAGNTPHLETPSKRKSLDIESAGQPQGSPVAKRVRILDQSPTDDIPKNITNDTKLVLEDEIPEDVEELTTDSSQVGLEVDVEQLPEENEIKNDAEDDEREEIGDFPEEGDVNLPDETVESVKSVDISKDDYVSTVDDDFIGTPEATEPLEPAAEAESAIEPKVITPLVTDEPTPAEPVVSSPVSLPKTTAVIIKSPNDMDPLPKPVLIQRPAASPSTPSTSIPAKSASATTPIPKKEITLKKSANTSAVSESPVSDSEAAALKQQKTLLLQKKLEALRAGDGKSQKPKIIRTTSTALPTRGSGRGRATISIRGSRGRGNPSKSTKQ
jgi:hypothetical protein